MPSKEPFHVGDWLVEPDLGQISRDSESTTLRRQVMELLVFLAEQDGGVVATDDLLGQLWTGKYVTEGTLYNCVGELRAALGTDREYVETIPRKGYRLVAPVSGADAGADDNRQGLRIVIVPAVLALMIAVVAAFILNQRATDDAESPEAASTQAPIRSIAVLPFDNLTANEDLNYVGDGLAEALINQLAQLPGLRVTARTSSFAFKGQSADIRDIADVLAVDAVIEGSVQQEASTLRIYAQLIDSRTGMHVWSQKYDRDAANRFDVQDEIALAVANSIYDGDVGPDDLPFRMARSKDATAQDLYEQGMVELNRLFAADQSNTDMHAPAHALEFFERATELDDEFALAWAARARSLAIMTMMEQVAPAQGWPQVQGFVNTALELAPDLAEVQIAAGQNSRGAEALSHYDRAIEINPNHAQAHVERAAVLRRMGRYREAFDANTKALELDPRSGWAVESALYASFYQGDLENFDRRIEEMQRLWPAANGLVAEAHLRMETGQLERFAELQLRANDIPDIGVLDWYASAPRHFGDSYLALGLEEHARGWLVAPGMKARYDDVIDLYNGDFDAAIAFLSPEIVKSRDRPRYAYRWYPEVIASLVESYLYARRYEELASLLTELDWKPGLYPLPDGTVPAPPWPEVAYAYALFETGQTDLGHEWLDNLVAELEHRLEEGIRMPNHFYELARLRGMQGRTDDALAALQTAIDLGWRRWYFDRDPVLDPIRTHPQYADLKAAYDADIARMRASVLRDLAAAASGDNDVVKLR